MKVSFVVVVLTASEVKMKDFFTKKRKNKILSNFIKSQSTNLTRYKHLDSLQILKNSEICRKI